MVQKFFERDFKIFDFFERGKKFLSNFRQKKLSQAMELFRFCLFHLLLMKFLHKI